MDKCDFCKIEPNGYCALMCSTQHKKIMLKSISTIKQLEDRLGIAVKGLEHFAKLDIQDDKVRYQCNGDAENIRFAREALEKMKE